MKLAGPLAAASVLAIAAGAYGAQQQSVTGPVAEYWMDVSTSTGLGGMLAGAGAAGGGRPSLGSIAGMLGGAMNPNAVNHSLDLNLGSSRTTASPAATHAPPAVLGVGASLPLVTPQRAAPGPATQSQPGSLEEYRAQRPQGKMLIYWGCGEHAPAGQPITIDFAQLGANAQGLAQVAQAFKPFTTTPENPPSPSRNATYGGWPNAQNTTAVPATGSLVGEHLIRGNYSPDIRFTLGANQDFMGPLTLTTNARAASGATNLAWSPASGAKAYLATLIGAGGGATAGNANIVMWSSSQAQVFAFAAPQYLSNGDIDRLVASHHLMDANTTSCTVPAEVGAQVQGGLVNMTAFGGEADFSDPPRPAAPAPWNISWTVKVRYRSATSALLGQSLGGPGGGRAGAAPPAPAPTANVGPSTPPPSGQTPGAAAAGAAGRAAAGALMRGLLGR